MVVYLDALFLLDSFVHFIFTLFVEKLYGKQVKILRIIIIAIVSGLISVLALFSSFVFILVKIFGGFLLGLISFKSITKSQKVIKISLYYVMNFVLVGMLSSFKIDKWYLLLISLALVLIIISFEVFKKYDIFIKRSTYNILLLFDKYKIKVDGFLDTGNQLVVDGIPVIFLDYKYLRDDNPTKVTIVKTVTGDKELMLYYPEKCFIYINNKVVSKDVYVCYTSIDKECLLNPFLFL